MKWVAAVVGPLTLLMLFAAACGTVDEDDGSATISVVATTTQIEDMARQVAGDRAQVSGLLPANSDPHDFEPTPRDLDRVAVADLVLEHGMQLDSWAGDIVKNSYTKATVVVVTTGIPAIQGLDEETSVDPHVWFDVANAKIMVTNIRDALTEVDPDGAATYASRSADYLAQLDELDAWIRQRVETVPPAARKLVTNHDVFGYFVRAYGFTYVGSIIPSLDAQSQPSARDTAALIDKIKAEGVKAIFTEASLNPKLARQLADEAGVAVVDDLYGDSLGPKNSGADTYIGMMRTDVTLIVEALR